MKPEASLGAVSLLKQYFESALVCKATNRHFGVEIETLFVDSVTEKPISKECSQGIMLGLVKNFDWRVQGQFRDVYGELVKDEFILKYDVGCNLFEMVTPAVRLLSKESLFARMQGYLNELYEVARSLKAQPLFKHCDYDTSNTVLESTEMDSLYWDLNGPAIIYLGHIAAIHYNIDLTSIEEGMSMMKRVLNLSEQKNWPPPESLQYWKEFMESSVAKYESKRFGPPPVDYDEYLTTLGSLRVFMNNGEQGLFLERPPKTLEECSTADLNLFVTYVWWWVRFRVRNDKLVLEIRTVPRQKDADIVTNFNEIITACAS